MRDGDNATTLDEHVSELNQAAIDMLVSVGMISAVIDNYPEHVSENFGEKIETLGILMREQTQEIQSFGGAYDDADEG